MAELQTNPIDPKWFELRLIFLRITDTNRFGGFGWTLRQVQSGLITDHVEEDSTSKNSGVKVGDIVLAINQRRVSTTNALDTIIRQSHELLAVVLARRRLEQCDVERVVIDGLEERLGYRYVMLRLDKGMYEYLGVLISPELTVRILVDGGAACGANFEVDDQIIFVGKSRIRDLRHFNMVMKTIGGDPIDVIVERRIDEPVIDEHR